MINTDLSRWPQLFRSAPLPVRLGTGAVCWFQVISSLMTSLPAQRTFCSGCARPWRSTQFRSCDNCRRRASQRAVRARQLSVTVGKRNILTGPPPPLTSPSVPAFSTLHFSCSTCARPCRSSYHRTCNRCRQAATRRTVASYQVLGVVRPSYLLHF
jgi:predicted amidophosphoribosyltransferase